MDTRRSLRLDRLFRRRTSQWHKLKSTICQSTAHQGPGFEWNRIVKWLKMKAKSQRHTANLPYRLICTDRQTLNDYDRIDALPIYRIVYRRRCGQWKNEQKDRFSTDKICLLWPGENQQYVISRRILSRRDFFLSLFSHETMRRSIKYYLSICGLECEREIEKKNYSFR